MKTLYLLRHAKSDWGDPGLADHDRPLAPRGQTAAPRVAAVMAHEGLVPAHVLCSTATRARETWDLIAETWGTPVPFETRRAIYDADGGDLIAMAQRLDEALPSAMLVGHNPAMEEAAARLAGDGAPDALQALAGKYPTAALAVLTFPGESWRAVRPGAGTLTRFLRPKDLPPAAV